MSGSTSSNGQFLAQNGQIIGPNGQPFIARGIDLWYSDMGNAVTSANGAPLTTLFPSINMVRVYDTGYDGPASFASFINTLTSQGIVVDIVDAQNYAGNGGGGSGSVFTGQDLTTELNWYSSMASYYKGNPYVWLGTNNEPSYNPSLAALSTWQQETYNAIRATGNNNIVMVDEPAGGNPGTMGPNNGLTASDYAGMTNIVWDLHYYGWVSGYSTNQATVTADLMGSAASGSGILGAESMPADGGTAPVIIGEYGNSTNGSSVDANWQQVVTAVQSSGSGSTAWAWDGGGAGDDLTSNGTLTAYGQEVAAYIAAGATPPLTDVSPNDTMVLAGSTAAIVDASGNTWTISSAGHVAVNGTADTTTANVIELAYVQGTIWQENSSDVWWGKTSPTAAWSPTTGTSTSPLPAPIIISAGTTNATVSQSQVSVVATLGSHMVFISGSGDIVNLTGGANSITDTGHGNTYILPAAGQGADTFNSNVLSIGDTLDLKTALAATNWNGATASLSHYLTVTNSTHGVDLAISATRRGVETTITTIMGTTSLSLPTLLLHSII